MKTPRSRLILLAAVLSVPFWRLGHPLWEVDDARYAEIPREMRENGDWLTPRLNYLDYVEKPPLIYWLGASSYKVLGVGEAAARLPLALAALLLLLGTWWLGSWLFSPSIGLYGALILGTSFQFFGLSRVITPDMTVSAALLWATGMILRALRRPEDARWAGPAAWAAMALAFLSKGLIGLILPGAWTAGLVWLYPGLRRGLKPLLLGWGPALFILLVAPWLAAMERLHPGFLRFFFVEQHFLRYLTHQYNRPGPWYYFFLVELGGTFPWTPLALWAAVSSLGRRCEPRRRQLGLWVALVFLFFSASSSKLLTYILPLFAHQSILAAELLSRLKKERGLELAAGAVLAAYAVLLAGAGGVADRFSVKPLALEIASRIRGLPASAPPPRIMTYETYLHGIPFYTGRPVDVIVNWVGELHYAKRDPRTARRFGDDDTVRTWPEGRGTYVAVSAKDLPRLLSLKPPGSFKKMQSFGRWVLVEL